jgi:multidrug efflux system outer membrane protein
MKTYQTLYSILMAAALLFLSGCKIMQPVQHASSIKSPETFSGQTDSTGIGTMQWKTFFRDPNLTALIDTALMNNPDLKMAVQRMEMARTNIAFATGALFPSVNAEISGGGRKFGDYTMDGVGNYDTNFSENIDSDRRLPAPFLPDYFVGFRSTWEVDIWGKLKTQRRAAYTRFLATEKGKHLVTTSLIAEVAGLYYELLAMDSELAIIQKNIALQASAVENIKIQKEGGRANELGVRQFTAQLLNTQGLEFRINQQITEAENNLNLLLGRFPQKIRRSGRLNENLPESVQAGIPSKMLIRRPDIRQAELDLLASHADLQAARLAFLPSLNAFKGSLLFNPGSVAYSALGGLAAPIFNRKALKSGQKRLEAASVESLFAYNKAILTGFKEVSTSLRKIENTRKIADFKEEEVEVLQQAVTTSRDLFTTGYATYLEIITAQKNVLEAELALTEVQKEQHLALIELYRSLGGGWE